MPEAEVVAAIVSLVGIVVGALTVLKLLGSGLEYVVERHRRYREWRDRPTYILKPTIEEIARFSVKVPDARRPNLSERLEELSIDLDAAYFRFGRERVVIVMGAFTLLYAMIFGRLISFGF